MAKARKSKNKEAQKVKKDSKPTTPTKIMNGKVRKRHVNTKMKNKSNENIKTNSGEHEKCSRLRKLSVRIKRITVDSNANNKIGTLEAQCKENKKKQKCENIAKITLEQDRTNSDYSDKKSRKKVLRTCLSDATSLNSNNSITTRNPLCNNKRGAKKIHLHDAQSPPETRKCLVKIKKIPLAKNRTESPEKLISSKSRKSVVRLPKTPDVVAAPPSKQCVVRLKDIAIDGAFSTNEDSVCFNVPVIDNMKRKNFSKLSLSKASKKFLNDDKSVKTAKEIEKENCTIAKNVENILDTAPTFGKENVCELKTLTKNDCSIKQIAKLSLKRKVTKNDVVKKNILQDSNFEQQLNFSVLFNPVRNSTVLELDKTKNKRQECSKEEINLNSSSKDRSSSQNLANRSDEIESLLNSLDDGEEILLKAPEKAKETSCKITEEIEDKNEKSQTHISKNNNTTKKFFHHKTENATMKNFKEPPQRSRKSNTLGGTKKRRSTKGKRDNIYEFLSQSQTSDSDTVKHADPAADIVKKLIAEGKVRVATNCKGKGKPKFKNVRIPMKQTKKGRPIAGKKLNQVKNKTKKVAFVENKESGSVEEDNYGMDHFDNDHFDDYYDNDDPLFNLDHEMEPQRKETAKGTNSANIHKLVKEHKGTFSNLARKVLMNEAGRSNSKNKTQAELLNAVRNIISTPKNKKMPLPHTALESELSPIINATSRPLPQASPWRVNEDAYLPRTFNFSTSSANLPSYSSDIIPSTPRKEKPRKSPKSFDQTDIPIEKSLPTSRPNTSATTFNSDRFDVNHKNPTKSGQVDNVYASRVAATPTTAVFQNPLANSGNKTQHQMPALNEPSIISSFSSNDSNAENMPPPKRAPENQNENDNIFNLKQLPNPRRALKYRSPLKTINILEVVQLPPYKHPNKNLNSIGSEQVEFGFEENLDKSLQEDHSIATLNAKQQNVALKRDYPKEDLFGFEDFLSQTDTSSQENVEFDEEKTRNEHNQTIHDKLQDLRKLKPAENELQNYDKLKPKQQIKNIPIFGDHDLKVVEKRQRGIKEMLCSTMLDTRPSTSKAALKELHNAMSKNARGQNLGKDSDISELFADPEPETTFNESEAHRTYTSIRPQKRKRRLKENHFVMYLESDESEDESNSTDQHKQHSRESDKSIKEATPKKKRHRHEPKENPELIKFVKEFNDLCKEVESHELLVEKSV